MAEKEEIREHRWTMVIDLDRCTGCQACVVACHAENNVPVVGPDEVQLGRAMHWLRIERYWEGEYPNVRARFLPIMCQQCEKAPCEPVCPVFATYHSEVQNLNVQVYNRCIGTRYCANNCPYIARVFNWFNPDIPEPLTDQLNPDVTVRRRGIMEKCTFCIQRIRRGEETAEAEGRSLRDGEVQPACAQSCPTGAILFGDLNDPDSQVARLARSRRRFRLLEELGTEPSVIYLKGGESHVG
ncbi:MAG: 4Fe-4S dicluster domain-containing protein [Caldilineae bacterium]|nr:MAG: 4Fe-4S dicluster domain-containing protein [Caldilineae bacterium]